MTHEEPDVAIKSALKEYWGAKSALAALEASLEEIATSSSLTSEQGYLMDSPFGFRLLDTNYVREQVDRYYAEKRHKEDVRKRLIGLGVHDPG